MELFVEVLHEGTTVKQTQSDRSLVRRAGFSFAVDAGARCLISSPTMLLLVVHPFPQGRVSYLEPALGLLNLCWVLKTCIFVVHVLFVFVSFFFLYHF